MVLNLSYVKRSQRNGLSWQHAIKHCIDKPLTVKEFPNGVIIPKRLDNTAVTTDENYKGTYIDEEVVYIGSLMMAWGHCYTDNIARLWFLQYETQYESLKKLKYVFHNYYPEQDIPDNFYVILENLGIARSQVLQISEQTQFKKVYYADDCYIRISDIQTDYTKEFQGLFAFLVNNINSKIHKELSDSAETPKKLYLSREKLGDKRDYGEQFVREVFEALDYAVVYPEQLSLYQQVYLLQNADEMCATEGSIAHNAIFMKPKAKLIVLRKADYLNATQPTINQFCDLDITYIDVHKSICASKEYPWGGPFFIYNTRFLKRYSKICGGHFPLILFKSYYVKNTRSEYAKKMIKTYRKIKKRVYS